MNVPFGLDNAPPTFHIPPKENMPDGKQMADVE
jgi:hypothetical protein